MKNKIYKSFSVLLAVASLSVFANDEQATDTSCEIKTSMPYLKLGMGNLPSFKEFASFPQLGIGYRIQRNKQGADFSLNFNHEESSPLDTNLILGKAKYLFYPCASSAGQFYVGAGAGVGVYSFKKQKEVVVPENKWSTLVTGEVALGYEFSKLKNSISPFFELEASQPIYRNETASFQSNAFEQYLPGITLSLGMGF